MKHKIRIFSNHTGLRRLWYTDCRCGWEPAERSPVTGRYGRPHFDAALAVGVAHQKDQEQ